MAHYSPRLTPWVTLFCHTVADGLSAGEFGRAYFFTTFTVLSVGSMTNFIPSGASGTESMAELANSEKLSGTRPFFSMN